MRTSGILVALALSAWNCSEHAEDDVTSDSGASGADAGADSGADAEVSAPTTQDCQESLSGDQPFGRHMAGKVTLYPQFDGSPVGTNFEFDVYFPAGRVYGAPVVIAHRTAFPAPGLATDVRLLDADLGTDVALSVHEQQAWSFDGQLLDGDGGVFGTFSENLADPGTDVANPASGAGTLCPSGPVPLPVIEGGGSFAPTSPIRFVPEVPLDEEQLAVAATCEGAAIDVSVQWVDGAVVIRPVEAFPPNGTVLFDLSGTTDILGRELTLQQDYVPLTTTAVVSDMSFEALLPQGAIATTGDWQVDNGALRLGVGAPTAATAFDAVVALPDAGAFDALRIKASAGDNCTSVRFAVVTQDGHAAEVAVAGPGEEIDVADALAGAGAQWLSVNAGAHPNVQQWGYVPACEVVIEELGYE